MVKDSADTPPVKDNADTPPVKDNELVVLTPDTFATYMALEAKLRDNMVIYVKRALRRDGATAQISGRTHYTRQGLLAVAGHLGVSCAFRDGRECDDPHTEARGYEVTCTATRADGVSQEAVGFASLGERLGSRPRWEDFFAVRSMAQTRAQVRALNALLMPIIVTAMGDTVDVTPAEDMPPERPPSPAPRNGSAIADDLSIALRAEGLEPPVAIEQFFGQPAGSKAHVAQLMREWAQREGVEEAAIVAALTTAMTDTLAYRGEA